eukprot:TRINITY_DN16990_c0_g1_i1.p1 TRINITY_DN16990_c0_g1~~TRINITY_DN16990_c0_g1_i1.p1  ORF type:complete len:507 (+),score=105.26 TRINITY_DN16990_c0_g1_i1:74-1522(+)
MEHDKAKRAAQRVCGEPPTKKPHTVAVRHDVVSGRKVADISDDDVAEIAHEAYTFLYSLVLMELTRKQMTNANPGVQTQLPGVARTNEMQHASSLPTPKFHTVVKPNLDTLYTYCWMDLTSEPMIISVPAIAEERFYMLQLLDMWTDTFAVIGTRTTGCDAGNYAIVAPSWSGKLPAGVQRVDSPSSTLWLVGRTQVNGQDDLDKTNEILDCMSATPLSHWGGGPFVLPYSYDSSVSRDAPVDQVSKMPADVFINKAMELMRIHAPHVLDQPMVARMARIGLDVSLDHFEFSALSQTVQQHLTEAVEEGTKNFESNAGLPPPKNGWEICIHPMGVWGTCYQRRAYFAMSALAVNCPEDAVYPYISNNSGNPDVLDGHNTYTMYFGPGQLPPARAFWSLTLYDDKGFLVENDENRYALTSRDKFKFGDHGSLELCISHTAPGSDSPNWLPAPAGSFQLQLRLYLPAPEVLTGAWAPPAVKPLA